MYIENAHHFTKYISIAIVLLLYQNINAWCLLPAGSEKKHEKLSSSVRAVRKGKKQAQAADMVEKGFLYPQGRFIPTSLSLIDQTSKLKYILREARYFLIKSNNHENVSLAKAKVCTLTFCVKIAISL